jgi:hypothetical protein
MLKSDSEAQVTPMGGKMRVGATAKELFKCGSLVDLTMNREASLLSGQL